MNNSSSSAALSAMAISEQFLDEVTPLRSENRRSYRNLIAFWILGVCNNFGYVVMLSAAHDILSRNTNHTEEALSDVFQNTTRTCNPTSTGAILLADILPSLAIKLAAPFFPFFVHIRMLLVVLLSVVGFLVVSFSYAEWMAVIGVVATSLASGLGEVTLLSYSSKFNKNVISTWSSGTGAAGILGAVSYAGFIAVGLSAATTLHVMVTVPLIMALTFWIMLRVPTSDESSERGFGTTKSINDKQNQPSEPDSPVVLSPLPLTMKEKLRIVPSLLVYMIPLGLVYLFEYFINQGLFELIYFPNIWLDLHAQYRWFQVEYQLGVLISRSSVNLLHINRIWLLAVLQFVNVIFFLLEAIYWFVPSFWIISAFVVWEGLLGGAAYVNTFYNVSTEVPEEKKEFAMGITCLADAVGIGLAGAIAIPVHDALCKLPLP